MDPYRVLNVRRNASPEAIRRAYRRAAKKVHPDVSGDREAFERLRLAYGVLSDPVRRARYDQTGELDPGRPDNSHGPVLTALACCFQAVLAAVCKQGADATREDLVQHMRQAMTGRRDALVQQRAALETAQQQLDALRGRFAQAEGDSLLDQIVEAQRATLVHKFEALDGEVATLDRALDYLKGSRFRRDPVLRRVVMMAGTASSGWATSATTT